MIDASRLTGKNVLECRFDVGCVQCRCLDKQEIVVGWV